MFQTKNAKNVFLLFIGMFILSGCETMSDQELQAKFEAKCERYGFKKATDAFANCLMESEQNYYAALSGIMNKQSVAIKSQSSQRATTTRCSTVYEHTNCTTY